MEDMHKHAREKNEQSVRVDKSRADFCLHG